MLDTKFQKKMQLNNVITNSYIRHSAELVSNLLYGIKHDEINVGIAMKLTLNLIYD